MGRGKNMYGRGFPNCASMGEPKVKQEREIKANGGRTVRFRVASANSGRVLTEVFKDETASWCGSSVCGSVDSDCSSLPEAAERDSDTNSHLRGLVSGATLDESGCEPDDLLLYASANKRELRFSNKRVNICSKNGTIRGVRNKVSAGQVLFNNLSNLPNMYTVNLRSNKNHQKKRPWEKD